MSRFGSLGKCANTSCFPFVLSLVEGLDEVVLEDLSCHFLKMVILVPPSVPLIPLTFLASSAIDPLMPASSLVHLVSTP